MRRNDRAITDREDLLRVMRQCDVCRLALNDDGYPYIIPLTFGLVADEGGIRLYFHSATEGKKLELIARDPRASFEMDCNHQLQYFADRGYCTMAYESVIGRGEIRILSDEEKPAALRALMAQYHPEGERWFSDAAIPRTTVYCLTVSELTGKRKNPK